MDNGTFEKEVFSNYKYQIVEEKENAEESVIEKSGMSGKFRMLDLEMGEKKVKKLIKEVESQVGLESAKVINVETHHPFVADFSDEQLSTIKLYAEAKETLKDLTPRLEMLNLALEEYADERAEIAKQIGIAIPLKDVSPVEQNG